MSPDRMKSVQGPEVSYQLQWQAAPPEQWVLYRPDQPETPIAHVSGTLPEDYHLTAYAGKGGPCLALDAPGGLTYFLFPGAQARVASCQIQMTGQTLLDACPSADHAFCRACPEPPAHPQSVTRQAMVLGAGIGTRILPLTDERTGYGKPALPLDHDHTVIGRILHQLSLHGIEHVFVNTFFGRESVRQALNKACEQTGLQWHEIPESRATGTAGGLVYLMEHPEQYPAYNPQEPLLILQGDAVTTDNLSQLLNAHAEHGAQVTLGCQIVADEDVSKFGIVAVENTNSAKPSGPIVQFLEKPALEQAGPNRLANAGFYVLSPQAQMELQTLYHRLLKGQQDTQQADQPPITELKEFDFAKDFFPAVMAKQQPGALWAEAIEGFWCDIGNPVQYLQTVQALYEGWLQTPFPIQTETTGYDCSGVVFWPGAQAIHQQQPVPIKIEKGVLVAKCQPFSAD